MNIKLKSRVESVVRAWGNCPHCEKYIEFAHPHDWLTAIPLSGAKLIIAGGFNIYCTSCGEIIENPVKQMEKLHPSGESTK